MDSGHLEDVSYGNLGQARYDTSRQAWRFERRPGHNGRLHILWRSSSAPFARGTASVLALESASSKDRNKNIKKLLRSNPELVPAAPLIGSEYQISKAIESIAAGPDPFTSDLLAVGYAGDYETRAGDARQVDIVASISGLARDAVRLALFQSEVYACKAYKDTEFLAYSIDAEQQGWHFESHTPIQQLCFSAFNPQSGGFLAVRRLYGTTILRPAYRRSRVRPSSGPRSKALENPRELSPSRLDPNFLLEISVDATGGTLHADVSFNPQCPNQFAIIDMAGFVKTFTLVKPIGGRRIWELEEGPSTLVGDRTDGGELKAIQCDGWAAVIWAVDDSVLVASTRRTLKALVLQSESFVSMEVPNVLGTSETDWILDIKRDQQHPANIYVLTSSRIVWLHIRKVEDQKLALGPELDARIVLSFSHYRTAVDYSMRLIIIDGDMKSTLFIYSRNSAFTVAFTVYHDPDALTQGCVSDPYQIGLAQARPVLSDGGVTESLFSIAASPVVKSRSLTDDSGSDSTVVSDIPRLTQLFYIKQDLVTDSVICAEASKFKEGNEFALCHLRSGKNVRKGKTQATVEEAYFIVPDEQSLYDDHVLSKVYELGNPLAASRKETATRSRYAALEWLSDEIARGIVKSFVDVRSLGSFEEVVESILKDREDMQAGVHTLAEFLAFELPIDEIGKVSDLSHGLLNAIEEFSTKVNQDEADGLDIIQQLKTLSLSTAETLKSFQNAGEDEITALLIPIYEDLLEKWIRSLARDATPRQRVWQERIVRRISMQLFMASHGVQPASKASAESKKVTINSPASEVTLPVREKRGSYQPTENGWLPSSSLPSPSLLRLPQISITSSSQDLPPTPIPSSQQTKALDQPREAGSWEPGHSIRKYCTLKDRAPLSSALGKIVGEWQVEKSPVGFRWPLTRDGKISEGRSHAGKKRRKRRTANARPSESSPHDLVADVGATIRTSSPSIPYVTVMKDTYSQETLLNPMAIGSSQVSTQSKKVKKPRLQGFL